MEKKKIASALALDDEDLDKVSGGGLFSTFSEEEYREAGLSFEWGLFVNGDYTLITSGEKLTTNEAENAVIFYKYNRRVANSKAEINNWWENVYRVEKAKNSSWNGSESWN
jgi:hypothetical protein